MTVVHELAGVGELVHCAWSGVLAETLTIMLDVYYELGHAVGVGEHASPAEAFLEHRFTMADFKQAIGAPKSCTHGEWVPAFSQHPWRVSRAQGQLMTGKSTTAETLTPERS